MKTMILLSLEIGLLWSVNTYSQHIQTNEKLSVDARMAKAREAKAQKKATKPVAKADRTDRVWPSTPADQATMGSKVLKGPHGETIHTGERGARFYINKNGNKTFLSSNQ